MLMVLVSCVGLLANPLRASLAAEHWLKIERGDLVIGVDEDLSLTVYDATGEPVWQTMKSATPGVTVAKAGEESRAISLSQAADRKVEDFDDGTYRGKRIRLAALPDVDVEVEVVLGLADSGELCVEVEQVGGEDTVQRVSALYSWSLKPEPDSYMVVPHGSGYLIRSDATESVGRKGFVGAAFSLPLFGMVRGENCCYQIIETWWDAHVEFHRTPGEQTVLALDWEDSLGKLAYRRRVLIRFAKNLGHVGMAKAYRRYLVERGEFSTLRQRAEKTPALNKFLAGIEYRFVGWNPEQQPQVLENIRKFQEASLPVTFFYPKWPARGYSVARSGLQHQDAGWQGFLQEAPVPGGWPAAKELEQAARELGCAVKVMVNPTLYFPDAPAYDPAKATNGWPAIRGRWAEWAIGSPRQPGPQGLQTRRVLLRRVCGVPGSPGAKRRVGVVQPARRVRRPSRLLRSGSPPRNRARR